MMKNPILPLLVFLFSIAVRAYSLDVSIEGDASSAPIYTLEGHADTTFRIDDYMNVNGGFEYSMNNVNSGLVTCIGNYKITTDQGTEYPWDANFNIQTTYNIKQYGRSIMVSFNHVLRSTGNGIIDGEPFASATVTSKGVMQLLQDFTFYGSMKGQIIARDSAGRVVNKHNYPTDSPCTFFQRFSNITSNDWGIWSGDFSVNQSKNKLFGSGSLTFGSANDPVDTVAQNLKGTINKSGIFSWNTTSTSKADNKVKLTIKHDSNDQLVTGQNAVSAAAQSRKF